MSKEPRFKKNDDVTLRHDPGVGGLIIDMERRGDDQYYYRVFIESSRRPWFVEHDLIGNDLGKDPLRRAEQDVWGSPQAFQAHLTLKKLRNPLTDLLYSYQASRTDLLPHQFIPLLKVLDSPLQRILIADEVGLGKTIEAGLIMAEQRSRGHLRRVLVVCQGALLMRKWVTEMRHRFDEPFELLTTEKLEKFLLEFEEGRDPELKAVASLPLLRSERWVNRLQELRVTFDMVVVDEAHRLKNRHSVSYQLGETLAQYADMLVLLTATPLQLGEEDLFSLLHLLDPARFPTLAFTQELLRPQEILNNCISLLRTNPPPLVKIRKEFQRLRRLRDLTWLRDDPILAQVESRLAAASLTREERIDLEGLLLALSPLSTTFTRTRRADLQLRFAQRTPVRVPVQLEGLAQELLADVETLARAIFSAAGSPFGAGLASITLRRQAASCLPATLHYLRDVLSNAMTREEIEEELSDLDLLPDQMSTSFFLDPRFHADVKDILRKYSSVAHQDLKWTEFLRHLRQQIAEGQPKFVLFSFFKRTLAYLQVRLREEGLSTHLLTGDVPADDREEVVEAFRLDPLPAVLLSSEVGGEGLDFQFAAVMFNYDMPWNPMVVEQRIGRIDRYGQASERVVIFNFSVIGTIEERIFERLYDRIEIFRRSVGDLEAILGEQLGRLTQDILKYKLTAEELAARAEKLADALVRDERKLAEVEKEGGRIAGDDSYFLQRVGEVRSGKRFLQPAELERLVSIGIELISPKSRMIPVAKKTGVQRLHEANALWTALGARTARDRAGQQLLQKLGSLFHHPELTFLPDIAKGDRSLALITSRHPLLELLKNDSVFDEDEPTHLSPTAALICPGLPPEEYLVFFFLLAFEGLRRNLTLSAIPVGLSKGDVQPHLEESIFVALNSGRLSSWDNCPPVGHRVQQARQSATSELVWQKSQKEQALTLEAERIAKIRADSLTATYLKRRDRLRSQIELVHEERIARMHHSSLERLDRIYQADLEHLEGQHRVHCQEELIGVAYCKGLGEA